MQFTTATFFAALAIFSTMATPIELKARTNTPPPAPRIIRPAKTEVVQINTRENVLVLWDATAFQAPEFKFTRGTFGRILNQQVRDAATPLGGQSFLMSEGSTELNLTNLAVPISRDASPSTPFTIELVVGQTVSTSDPFVINIDPDLLKFFADLEKH